MVLPRKTKSIGKRHEINIRKHKTNITNSNKKNTSKTHFLISSSFSTKRNKLTKVL